jgi:predicted glycoside hydrolase/deacetylase ChbG (UPF0249 family)
LSGLLIVNADDYGFNGRVTDTTLGCFEDQTISSLTAMVWMTDSDRAASLAQERSLPAGLHLNLTVPLNGAAVPEHVRERQFALTRHFTRHGWAGKRLFRAPPRKLIRQVVRDQLERFRELYGEPTHLDGHHHVHLHPRVIEELPFELPLRGPLRHPNEAEGPMRPDRSLRARVGPVSLTFAFEHLHPALGGEGFSVLARAAVDLVEVMTHPAQPGQRDALSSEAWRVVLTHARVGSFASRCIGPEVASRS